MRNIILFALAFIYLNLSAQLFQNEQLKKGETTTFKTKGKHHVNYHVYMPTSFDSKKLLPIIIAFSPGGNGKGILEKILPAAEKMGWIAVGCDSLRNGMKDHQLEIELEDVLICDILKTVPHNKERIYLAGFSGGAMRSYGISVRREEKYAGVLAFGGWLGGPDYQDEAYPSRLSVAMVNGNMDRGANAWIVKDTETLQKRGCSTKHFSFNGGHQTAPSEVIMQSLQWLNSQWTKKKNPQSTTQLHPLNILFIGDKGKRTNNFTAFLSSYFRNVDSSSNETFSFEALNKYDVIIVDKPVSDFPRGITKAMIITPHGANETCVRFGSKINNPLSVSSSIVEVIDPSHAIFTEPIRLKTGITNNKLSANKGTDFSISALKISSFEKAPDSEIIASCSSTEGKKNIVIVREASRLFWGFSELPSQMTENTKNTFINAITWIYSFDGHQQTSFAGIVNRRDIKALLKESQNDRNALEKWFTKDLLSKTDYDKTRTLKHMQDNLAYIYMPYGGGQLDIDEVAKQFQTPNNQLASLEKWIKLLKNKKTKKQALSLLLRYTNHRSRNVKSWQEWYDQNKTKLIFSDEEGYRFVHYSTDDFKSSDE